MFVIDNISQYRIFSYMYADAMDVMSTETPPTTTTGSEEDTDDPLPSAPPLYPVLPAGTPPASGVEPVDEEQTPVNTPTSSPLVTRSRSDFNMQRVRNYHTFRKKIDWTSPNF